MIGVFTSRNVRPIYGDPRTNVSNLVAQEEKNTIPRKTHIPITNSPKRLISKLKIFSFSSSFLGFRNNLFPTLKALLSCKVPRLHFYSISLVLFCIASVLDSWVLLLVEELS